MTTPDPVDDDGPHPSAQTAHDQLLVVATPGPGTAIVNAPIVMVIDAPATDPLVTDLVAPVLGQAGLTGVIRQIALHHLEHTPGFVCVAAEADNMRLLVRAPLTVQVSNGAETDVDTLTVDGEGRSTWHEVSVPYGGQLQITLPATPLAPAPDQSSAAQRIEMGVLPVGSVTISFTEAPNSADAPPSEPAAGEPSPREPAPTTEVPEVENPPDRQDPRPISAQTDGVETIAAVAPLPAVTPDAPTPGGPTVAVPDGLASDQPAPASPAVLDGDGHPHEAAVQPNVATASASAAHSDLDLVHLFDETTYRPAAPALAEPESEPLVHRAEAADETAPGPGVAAPAVDALPPPPMAGTESASEREVEPVSPPTVIPATVIAPKPAAGALISSVPGMGPSAQGSPEATPPAASPPSSPARATPAPAPDPPAPVAPDPTAPGVSDDPGDHDDVTISAAALRRMLDQRRQPDGRSPGATVASIFCPDGHPNPTHQDRCRACDQIITNRAASTIDRPVLGHLVFDTGLVVDVDQHLLIGRRPPDDQKVNGEPTRAVQLEDPEHLMSRTHLMVQLDGWQVLVVDRDSMNHTFVEVPGRAAFQLRPGEPYPIPPGTVVRLGEEASFTYDTRVR